MNDTTYHRGPGRGAFLRSFCAGTLGMFCLLIGLEANAASVGNCHDAEHAHADCGMHNMMVVGEETIFLSHLPMFQSEHRFQVVLEATFHKEGTGVDGIYTRDRKSHPTTKIYTLAPSDSFILAELFSADDRFPRRHTFQATVFRGHLERGGTPIEGLIDSEVKVTRVVYAGELRPEERKAEKLEYILFGRGQERFLAHRITQAPDFDHIVAVKMEAPGITEAELTRGVSVVIPDRKNAAAQRLKTGERVAALGRVTGGDQPIPLQLRIGTEYYFEEGELALPANFRQTPLEHAAGF